MNKKHGNKVLKALEGLEQRKGKLLELGQEMLSAYSGNLYPVDSLAIGAIKRTISMSEGMRILIESLNMLCARSLLRLQIDTALRFFAVFIVEDPHGFALKVLEGQQINRMKDFSGKLMTDAYLVSKLELDYPWLPTVYKNLSGYVHFSEHHLFNPVYSVDSGSRTVQYVIQEKDTKYPEFSWVEVIDCFNESVDIFIKYLKGWILTKENPKFVTELKKKLEKG